MSFDTREWFVSLTCMFFYVSQNHWPIGCYGTRPNNISLNTLNIKLEVSPWHFSKGLLYYIALNCRPRVSFCSAARFKCLKKNVSAPRTELVRLRTCWLKSCHIHNSSQGRVDMDRLEDFITPKLRIDKMFNNIAHLSRCRLLRDSNNTMHYCWEADAQNRNCGNCNCN